MLVVEGAVDRLVLFVILVLRVQLLVQGALKGEVLVATYENVDDRPNEGCHTANRRKGLVKRLIELDRGLDHVVLDQSHAEVSVLRVSAQVPVQALAEVV